MTEAEFRLFRDLIYTESGMCLRPGKKEFLENRIVKRMFEMDVTTPYWYYRLIIDGNKTELINLLDLLTINETSFFRNKPQFELLKKRILPEIIGKKERGFNKELRIWSAGCSTGEEPYTIAMIAKEVIPPEMCGITIFASDLSLTALENASRGVYDMNRVKNEIPPHYIKKYFEVIDGSCKVKEELKEMIVFDFHNMKYDHGLTDLDVIFCRNVMIYFDEEEQRRLIKKFYSNLNEDGYLLLGHAESIQGWDTGFEFVYDKKGTAYRKCKKELV